MVFSEEIVHESHPKNCMPSSGYYSFTSDIYGSSWPFTKELLPLLHYQLYHEAGFLLASSCEQDNISLGLYFEGLFLIPKYSSSMPQHAYSLFVHNSQLTGYGDSHQFGFKKRTDQFERASQQIES